MIYSTPEFFALLGLTLFAYTLARSQRGRFGVLLASSTAFYAWAGWFDFLILELVMLAAWLTVFFASIYPARRKKLTVIGISLIVLHLATWKYLPWISGNRLHWVVPLGISFYTLQKIGYLIDVYRGEAELISLREYLLFNGFFAQLVAGPITRARSLVPQLRKLEPIRAANFWSGMSLFLLGFFKKLVLADNLGNLVDSVFESPWRYGRIDLALSLIAFTCQLWADFSGYTDMGRGAARMFGIELPENFLSPFLARGPSEFWRRWHITLSEWLRDYLFVPLWMRQQHVAGGALAVVLTMILAGLWHGAGLIFIAYGVYWGVLLVTEHLWRRTRLFRKGFKGLPGWLQFPSSVLLMFTLTVVSRLLFRAGSFDDLGSFASAWAHPGRGFAFGRELFVLLIGCSFLIQLFSYRSLEAGSRPIGLVFLERSFGGAKKKFERSRYGVAAAGAALGAGLALLFTASVSLSMSPAWMRPFIYWTGR